MPLVRSGTARSLVLGTLPAAVLATLLAALVGLGAGAATSWLELRSPPWLGLILHGTALWALLTIGVGRHTSTWSTAAWLGLVTQEGLVVGYYVARDLDYDFLSLGQVFALRYLLWAVFAGPVFGVAGRALVRAERHSHMMGLAVAGAPWVADGVIRLQAAQEVGPRSGQYVVAGVLSIAVGLCLPRLLARSARAWVASLPAALAAAGVLWLLVSHL